MIAKKYIYISINIKHKREEKSRRSQSVTVRRDTHMHRVPDCVCTLTFVV